MNTQQAELTVHEQFEYISDTIGYDKFSKGISYNEKDGYINVATGRNISIKDMIFNQEFMDLYAEVLFEKGGDSYDIWQILKHLDNPTQYLFNLIK